MVRHNERISGDGGCRPVTRVTWDTASDLARWRQLVARWFTRSDWQELSPRKYSFSVRITNEWNSLPFSVVTAPSVNSFKNRLDKHWALQELRYDWVAELSGTASRSTVEFRVLWVIPS